MQYRTSFILDCAGSFAITFVDFLVIAVVFHNVTALAGWSLAEVAFFYGLSCTAFGLADFISGHMNDFHLTIRDGTFDTILVRPVGSLLQALSADLAVRKLGKLAQALTVGAVATAHLSIPWNPGRALVLVVSVVCGTAIFVSILVAGAATAVWTVDTSEATNSFTYGGNQLTTYPLNLYSRWLRRFMAFVIPLAFVTWFPSLYILDKPDPLGFPAWVRFTGPLAAAVSVAVAAVIWRTAVRHYRSTGS